MASTAPVVEKLLSNGHNHLQVQDRYVVPPGARPDMSQLCHSYTFPVIDLRDLDGPNRIKIVNEIRRACRKDGFFQMMNHGVPETVMKSMMGIAKEFLKCLWKTGNSPTSVCDPFFFLNGEVAGKYAKEIRVLVLRLLAAISEALGQHPDYLNAIFGKHTQIQILNAIINYHPSCPNPDLTFGVVSHSDPGGITVLMQGDVSGLQVLKWEMGCSQTNTQCLCGQCGWSTVTSPHPRLSLWMNTKENK
ncbi:protein DMR6-LIKE OXYGENASE 1-like [Cryptomeria japonica]|uniref:protein DMR6-LIKE OXYGENASE 1-like n=1 Tax=Cryptomeria japonica TaxID=3369 RepID=UPI0027DA38ED|nr:protein DMR6-LIKE OXYGENASE 1-like [Cryptomeria japonica]